jgi:hypothetical protein
VSEGNAEREPTGEILGAQREGSRIEANDKNDKNDKNDAGEHKRNYAA